MSSASPTTCFHTTRLNPSTFVIREEDSFNENPLIYAKLYSEPPLLLLSDTGCGGHNLSPSVKVTSLRNYLETYPIPSNLEQPLNPFGKLPYFIICSHCHFDHILGLPDFVTPHSNTTILASSNEPSFITSDLPTHSLCRFLGLSTPKYEISYWASHLEAITYNLVPLNIVILHTAGHTPDSIAWYDYSERQLYVGDSFYELRSPFASSPIIFPLEGDWIDYMQSLRTISSFITEQNDKEPSAPRVKISCAHITFSVDGAEIIHEIQKLFVKIIEGKVPVVMSTEIRGEICDLWMESPEARFSVRAPRRLADAAREFFSANPGLLLFRNL
jgi:glyoxylase-like metal-dependent hydrolase (beta-lactamase superfamily II)